jgi:hypothetical protein
MDYGEFMFIGSEAWGYKPDQFQTKKKLIGSITLALQMAENDNFTSFLSNLDIFTVLGFRLYSSHNSEELMPHNSLKAVSVPDSKTNMAFNANGVHFSCL